MRHTSKLIGVVGSGELTFYNTIKWHSVAFIYSHIVAINRLKNHFNSRVSTVAKNICSHTHVEEYIKIRIEKHSSGNSKSRA